MGDRRAAGCAESPGFFEVINDTETGKLRRTEAVSGIARDHPVVVTRRGDQAGDDQLPHAEAGARRAVLRAHLWPAARLGMPLRQVQALPLQGDHLRQVWRGGYPLEGAAGA